MKRITTKKIAALLLSLAMTTSLVACSNDTAPNSSVAESKGDTASTQSEPEAKRENVKLIIAQGWDNGVNTDELTKSINEKFDVTIEYLKLTDEQSSLGMAAGDMGCDIMTCSSTNIQQLVEGNLIIPLDDLVKSHGSDIMKNSAAAVAYTKEKSSMGTGKLFFAPVHSMSKLEDYANMPVYDYAIGQTIRWDYYKELGYPEVNNEDDLLKVLKQMQEKHPTTPDGKNVYPVTFWGADWGGLAPIVDYYAWPEGTLLINNRTVGVGIDNKIKGNVLEEDFVVWNSFKFYNKAYRMGILDPESFTQKFDNAKAKYISGNALFCPINSWYTPEINKTLQETNGEMAGMEIIPIKGSTFFSGIISLTGWGYGPAITATCKNPERAMEVINWLSSYEGARQIYSGQKDKNWSIENGVPAINKDTLAQKSTDPEFINKTGIQRACYLNMVGLDDSMVDPVDGGLMNLFNTKEMMVAQNNPFWEDYSKHFGASYPGEVVSNFIKEGNGKLGLFVSGGPMPTMPDDLAIIVTKMEDYLLKMVPKAINAASEAEFNTLVTTGIADLKAAGVQKVVDWVTTEYNKTIA